MDSFIEGIEIIRNHDLDELSLIDTQVKDNSSTSNLMEQLESEKLKLQENISSLVHSTEVYKFRMKAMESIVKSNEKASSNKSLEAFRIETSATFLPKTKIDDCAHNLHLSHHSSDGMAYLTNGKIRLSPDVKTFDLSSNDLSRSEHSILGKKKKSGKQLKVKFHKEKLSSIMGTADEVGASEALCSDRNVNETFKVEESVQTKIRKLAKMLESQLEQADELKVSLKEEKAYNNVLKKEIVSVQSRYDDIKATNDSLKLRCDKLELINEELKEQKKVLIRETFSAENLLNSRNIKIKNLTKEVGNLKCINDEFKNKITELKQIVSIYEANSIQVKEIKAAPDKFQLHRENNTESTDSLNRSTQKKNYADRFQSSKQDNRVSFVTTSKTVDKEHLIDSNASSDPAKSSKLQSAEIGLIKEQINDMKSIDPKFPAISCSSSVRKCKGIKSKKNLDKNDLTLDDYAKTVDKSHDPQFPELSLLNHCILYSRFLPKYVTLKNEKKKHEYLLISKSRLIDILFDFVPLTNSQISEKSSLTVSDAVTAYDQAFDACIIARTNNLWLLSQDIRNAMAAIDTSLRDRFEKSEILPDKWKFFMKKFHNKNNIIEGRNTNGEKEYIRLDSSMKETKLYPHLIVENMNTEASDSEMQLNGCYRKQLSNSCEYQYDTSKPTTIDIVPIHVLRQFQVAEQPSLKQPVINDHRSSGLSIIASSSIANLLIS